RLSVRTNGDASFVGDLSCTVCCLFFFQAEDGIRDLYVTGVQTCALPILARLSALHLQVRDEPLKVADVAARGHHDQARLRHRERSEERRVGKECGTGWARDH